MRFALLILTIFLSFSTVSAAPMCRALLEKAYPEVAAAQSQKAIAKKAPLVVSRDFLEKIKLPEMNRIFNVSAFVVRWQDLANLDQLSADVKTYAEEVSKLTPERRELERQRIINYLKNDAELTELFEGIARFQRQEFLPTQYELKKEYLTKLIEILKQLPRDFRPEVARIPWNDSREQLNSDSEKFVANFTKKYTYFLRKYLKIPYAEYVAQLRKSEDPQIQQALQLLDQEQLEVVIRRPESGRFWVPRVGFHNQYVTKTSRGSLDNINRMKAESRLTGTDYEEYIKVDNELKPKYGTLMASFDSKAENDLSSSSQYGEDFYVADMDKIKDRVTLSIGDSLGYGYVTWATTFSQRFIPWKYRYLLTEFIASSLRRTNKVSLALTNFEDLQENLAFVKEAGMNIRYFETQTFGRFDLDDIKEYFFTSNPPEGEFLKELRKRKIKIYDYRTGKPKLWRTRA